jgi:spore protease
MKKNGNLEYTRTDLACEWSGSRPLSEGTESLERAWSGGKVQTLTITSEDAARRFGRPRGQYVTVICGKIWEMSSEGRYALEEEIAGILCEMLRRETGKAIGGGLSVLVVGLGNREITADAIGPAAVDELLVTRHLKDREPDIFARMDCCAVSALAPGVLGQTGMEAAEVVAGAVRRSRPDAIVAIDALAARSCDRLACTVQLSDTGIAPGSGACNPRKKLGRDTLGIPVIALGVPTVVEARTLALDLMPEGQLSEEKTPAAGMLVAPKDIDLQVAKCAKALGYALNLALQGHMTAAEMEQFLC